MKWETTKYIKKWAVVLSFSAVAGIVGGLGAVLFRELIKYTHSIFFEMVLPIITFEFHGYNLGYIFLPALGSIIVIPIIKKCPELKGNGIPEVIEAVIFKEGIIKKKFAVLKVIATSITIGSGGSVGREGPIGFIGASLASMLTQKFKLSPEMRKLLTTCGLAAGIAGTFNTPLSGAMFALEVIYMGAFSINLVPIVIAAVVGNAVTLLMLKRAFEVSIPLNTGHALVELPFFFAMGLLFGVLAAAYAKFIYLLTDVFEKQARAWNLVLGGLGVGLIGMLFPKYGIFGVGYSGMEMAVSGLLPIGLLISLGLAKMLATSLTISSGHSGGIFAPSLYIGTMFGTAFGLILSVLFPDLGINPSSYALAGMAAFFSGLTQAPITQILMVTELTKSYALLPAVMTSSTVGFLTARFFLKGSSIYTLKLEKKGIHIRTGKPIVLEMISVKEIMNKEPVFVYEDTPLIDVEHLVAETGHDCFPVVDKDFRVLGIIGVKDFLKRSSRIKALPVKRFLNRPFAIACLNETAQSAFEKLVEYDQNLLPIVEDLESKKLVGVVTKRDIYKAYYKGLEGMYIE
ncbi:chloride channel protein [Palaeococcus pacificus]|nr:chloride channel protein [Palaeococcus pacificus]